MDNIKEYVKELKQGTKTMFKEFFRRETNKKQRANMWTFLRLISAFLIPILVLISSIFASPAILVAAIITTGFGALTDYFDGKSARKHNSYSEYGKLLDQVVDKIFSIMLGVSLSILNPLFLMNLFGEVMIATTNIYNQVKYKDINSKSTMIGKIKQWPLFTTLGLGFLSVLVPGITTAVNIAIISTFILQLGTIFSYVERNKNIKKEIKHKDIQEYIKLIDENETKDGKEKVIELNNNKLDIEPKLSKKEQYIKLRDALYNVIELKNNLNDDLNNEKQGIQKIKK